MHDSISPAKAPHFSRLGDVEVNAGQNASFQCMAAGRAAEAERFLLQVRGAQPVVSGVGWCELLERESFLQSSAPLYASPGCPQALLCPSGSPITPGQSAAPGTPDAPVVGTGKWVQDNEPSS